MSNQVIGLPALRAGRLVEEEAAHCVYHLRCELIDGEGPKGAGHAVCLHEDTAGEGQRYTPLDEVLDRVEHQHCRMIVG
jgi:hypothetical protein